MHLHRDWSNICTVRTANTLRMNLNYHLLWNALTPSKLSLPSLSLIIVSIYIQFIFYLDNLNDNFYLQQNTSINKYDLHTVQEI